jgi:AraC family transcriptional regulator
VKELPFKRISALHLATGEEAPVVSYDPVWSSCELPWKGFMVEHHVASPGGLPEIRLSNYLVCLRLGTPFMTEWQAGASRGALRELREPGDCCILVPGISAPVRWEAAAEVILIALTPSFMARAAHELVYPDRTDVIEQLRLRDPLVQSILIALGSELQTGCMAGPIYGEALASALSVHLLRHYSTRQRDTPALRQGSVPYKLRRAIAYICENLHRNLTLAEIASAAELNPYYFARAFKKATRLSPHQFVTAQRIERAKALLAKSELPMADVYRRSGFKSQSHFTTVFHRVTGITPKIYRDRPLN